MKPSSISRARGFTLLETVIAIGVLAVLLTGFMVVFAPAADGIRKSINVQQADRMASTLEQELVTLRGTTETTKYKTSFGKAFEWIKQSNTVGTALMGYQYRGEVGGTARPDGTPKPVAGLSGKLPGKDYVVVSMLRLAGTPEFTEDLTAIEGAVYLIKCTQLGFEGGQLVIGDINKIVDPKLTTGNMKGRPDLSVIDYPEAVVAFAAEFYQMPAKTNTYFSGQAFKDKFSKLKSPVFTRNLAVRR